MKEVVIVSGVRTAIGNFGGALKDIPVVNLGSLVIKEAVKRAGLKPMISDEVLGYAPKTLKSAGLIELEKKYQDWDESAKAVHIDESLGFLINHGFIIKHKVIINHVLCF